MSINPIYSLLDKYHPGIWCADLEYARNDLLIAQGEVEKYLYFIKEGAVRVFFSDGENENTIRLGYQGNVLNALPSFMNGQPSLIGIEALKKTIIQRAKKEDVLQVIASSAEIQLTWTHMLEQLFLSQFEREIDLLTQSPEKRYKRVLARSPQVFQEIPAKYIADYLRMSAETLSRLKKS